MNLDVWSNQTSAHPLALAFLGVAGLAIFLVVNPRSALIAYFSIVFFVPQGQRILVLGTDWSFVRIAVLLFLLRVFLRGEYWGLRRGAMDWAVCAIAAVQFIGGAITFGGSADILVNRAGVAFDTLGMYFVARVGVRNLEDLRWVLVWFAVMAAVSALFFLVERSTARNMFAVFGGVPEITKVRNGRLRCQGPFSHPIIAGVFFASLVPLLLSMLMQARWRDRAAGWIGIAAVLAIIFSTASSTPVSGLLIGVLCWLYYPLRTTLPLLRWAAVVLAIGLHFSMNNGIWHLLARVDLVGGSTGWHRYHLINQAINHFGEWWFAGTTTTAHWGIGLLDVTNHFILLGTKGGVLAVVILLVQFGLAWHGVGQAAKVFPRRGDRLILYGFGSMMIVHAAMFISVSYFGAALPLWSWCLAVACMISGEVGSAGSRVVAVAGDSKAGEDDRGLGRSGWEASGASAWGARCD